MKLVSVSEDDEVNKTDVHSNPPASNMVILELSILFSHQGPQNHES